MPGTIGWLSSMKVAIAGVYGAMERGWDPGEPLADVSPGMWIQERLWSWGPGSSRQGVAVGCIVPEGFEAYARLFLPHRAYFLFPGPIDGVAALSFGTFQHPANLWWPQTRTWCVATDIDLYETYIAGSEACIQRVVEDSDLEAFRVKLEDRVDIDGDLINR